MNIKTIGLIFGLGLTLCASAMAQSTEIKPRQSVEKKVRDYHTLVEGLTVSASSRLRYEYRDNAKFGADLPGNRDSYLPLQIRAGLQWAPLDWMKFVFEAQDSRVFGSDAINSDATPNVFADQVDLHRAYVELAAPGAVNVKLKVGRQKFNLGAKRLIASLEWVNTARVWDAISVTIGDKKSRTIQAFGSKVVPVNPNGFNDWSPSGNRRFDSFLHGIYYTEHTLVPYSKVELYWLIRHVSEPNDQVYTVGGRVASKLNSWDFEAELMGQFGKFGGLNHRAFAAHADIGYTVKSLQNLRMSLGYNFGSGDSDPNDDQHTTFDNLYPLNHAYYGYIDLASLQNSHVADAVISAKLLDRVKVRVAYHAFALAQARTDGWYNAGLVAVRTAEPGSDPSPFVGQEIDATVSATFWEDRISLAVGYGHFFPGAYVAATGPQKGADFFFQQTKLKF